MGDSNAKDVENAAINGDDDVSDDSEDQMTWKKYLKLVIPHVALVVVVCVYAVAGALVFYSVEAPYEEEVRQEGVSHINQARQVLLEMMWNNSKQGPKPVGKEHWMDLTEKQLFVFSGALFDSFQNDFVRYKDVRIEPAKSRVKRGAKSKDGTSETKLWTTSSSIFFAATTMATIGYGNIVPVTSNGRLICVFFALFGAPLAIITIGDLGKFLSECTIWLYKKLKLVRAAARRLRARFFGGSREDAVVTEICKDAAVDDKKSDSSSLDWEDLIMDKTQVPVVMVFAILLIYIALGAVLFSILEDWSYVDSFYFCFITLTTVGFGDLVPERHQYLVIMLLYIGVGLAVTTMCIDLVGIQYIQKIHYFGRKFRGTDLLQLLKRKRLIERRLAMQGGADEIMQMYLDQLQNQMPEEPEPDDWACDNVLTYEPKMPSPVPTPSLCSSVELRAMMYRNRQFRVSSWTESGPDLSFHCSLSTSPSVSQRERLYTQRQFYSPASTIQSFQFRFDEDPLLSPSPTEEQRREMYNRWRAQSPPESVLSFQYDFPMDLCMTPSPSEEQREEMYHRWRAQSLPESVLSFEYDFPMDLRATPSPSEEQREEMYRRWQLQSPTESVLSFKYEFPLDLSAIAQEARKSRRLLSCPDRFVPVPPSPVGLSCMEDWETYLDMLEYSKRPYVKPPSVLVEVPSESDEEIEPPSLLSPMETDFASSSLLSTPISSPTSDTTDSMELDLGAFEIVNEAGMSAEALMEEPVMFHESMPVHSVHHDTVQTEAALESLMAAPESMLSANIPASMVADNYCFVVDGDKIKMGDIMGDDQWWRHTGRPTKYYYSEDMKKYRKVNVIESKGRVISARFPSSSRPGSTLTMPGSRKDSPSPSPSVHNLTRLGNSHSISSPRASVSSGSGTPPRHSPRGSMTTVHLTGKMAPRRQNSDDGRDATLKHVYKVVRFYSFWKTCTAFHRIVTMISAADDKVANPTFKKRLFVQYIWRNAKPSEKARVQREFDPRRQRLLRYVTDPAARKRVFNV